MTPDRLLPARPPAYMIDRVTECRKMLLFHGFLTEAENKKVAKRIEKWFVKSSKEPQQ